MDGRLFFYHHKPTRRRSYFRDIRDPENGGYAFEAIHDDYYPEVTWENSPQRLDANEMTKPSKK